MKNIFLILTLSYSIFSYCQQSTITVEQDPFFETLLNAKMKQNEKEDLKDKYKVQVFYGENQECRAFLSQFKRDFKEVESTIVYTNPLFKVWAGNFETRLEGEKLLKELKTNFPTALLIKPSK
mgnify:CR=1 FL=1